MKTLKFNPNEDMKELEKYNYKLNKIYHKRYYNKYFNDNTEIVIYEYSKNVLGIKLVGKYDKKL